MDLFDPSECVAIVTGGARGIGFAITRGVASSGALVVIADINSDGAEKAAATVRAEGFQAESIAVDVTKRNSVQDVVAQTVEGSGQIDILVNCAGIILRKPIEEVTDEEWDSILDVNLRGVFLCFPVAGREMIKRKQGKIINISSNIAQVLQHGRGIYAGSKAGVSHLTKVMALKWAPYHINVNAIAPAPTMTDLNKKFFDEHPEDYQERFRSIPMGEAGRPPRLCGYGHLLGFKGLRLCDRANSFCRWRIESHMSRTLLLTRRYSRGLSERIICRKTGGVDEADAIPHRMHRAPLLRY